MPSEVVLAKIVPALKALLTAHAPLVALIGKRPTDATAPAVYDDNGVPQAAIAGTTWLPYVTVGAGTQVPYEETMGTEADPIHGWNCTVQVQAFGRVVESEIFAIANEIAKVLYRGRDLALTGYQSAWIDEFTVQPSLATLAGGVTVRQVPAIVRVLCHD